MSNFFNINKITAPFIIRVILLYICCLIFLNFKEIRKLNYYHQIILCSTVIIAIGTHALSHLDAMEYTKDMMTK